MFIPSSEFYANHFVQWAEQMDLEPRFQSTVINSDFLKILSLDHENSVFNDDGLTIQKIAGFLKLEAANETQKNYYGNYEDSTCREIVLYYVMLVISEIELKSQEESYHYIKSLDKLSALFDISDERSCFYSFVLNLEKKVQNFDNSNQKSVFDQTKYNLFNQILQDTEFVNSFHHEESENPSKFDKIQNRKDQMITYIIDKLIKVKEYSLALQFYYIFLPQIVNYLDPQANIITALFCATTVDASRQTRHENTLLSALSLIRQENTECSKTLIQNALHQNCEEYLAKKITDPILSFLWRTCRTAYLDFTKEGRNSILRPYICTQWDEIVCDYVDGDNDNSFRGKFLLKEDSFFNKNWEESKKQIQEKLESEIKETFSRELTPAKIIKSLPEFAQSSSYLGDFKDKDKNCQDFCDEIKKILNDSFNEQEDDLNNIMLDIFKLSYQEWDDRTKNFINSFFPDQKNFRDKTESSKTVPEGSLPDIIFNKYVEKAKLIISIDDPKVMEYVNNFFDQSAENLLVNMKTQIKTIFNNNIFKEGFKSFLGSEIDNLSAKFNEIINKGSKELKIRVFIQSSIKSNRIKEFIYLPFSPSEISDIQRALSDRIFHKKNDYMPQFQFSIDPQNDEGIDIYSPSMWEQKFNPFKQNFLISDDRERYDKEIKFNEIIDNYLNVDRNSFQEYRNRNDNEEEISKTKEILNDLVIDINHENIEMLNPSSQSCLLICNNISNDNNKERIGPLRDSIIAAANHKLQGFSVYFLLNPTSQTFLNAFSAFISMVTEHLTVYFIGEAGFEGNNTYFVFKDGNQNMYVTNDQISETIATKHNRKSHTVLISDCINNRNVFQINAKNDNYQPDIISMSLQQISDLDDDFQGIFTYYFWIIVRNNPTISPKNIEDFANKWANTIEHNFVLQSSNPKMLEKCIFPNIPSLLSMFNGPRRLK